MASASYIEKRRQRASERGRKGVAAKARRRMEQAAELRVVGTMVTSGVFGDHVVELLDGGDPMVREAHLLTRKKRTPKPHAINFGR